LSPPRARGVRRGDADVVRGRRGAETGERDDLVGRAQLLRAIEVAVVLGHLLRHVPRDGARVTIAPATWRLRLLNVRRRPWTVDPLRAPSALHSPPSPSARARSAGAFVEKAALLCASLSLR
jgi:hypothetical protein